MNLSRLCFLPAFQDLSATWSCRSPFSAAKRNTPWNHETFSGKHQPPFGDKELTVGSDSLINFVFNCFGEGGREQAWWEEADVPGVREYLVRVKITHSCEDKHLQFQSEPRALHESQPSSTRRSAAGSLKQLFHCLWVRNKTDPQITPERSRQSPPCLGS